MEFYDSLRWPHSAYHKEGYFGEVYDAGSKLMCEFNYFRLDEILSSLSIHCFSPVCFQRGRRHHPNPALWFREFRGVFVVVILRYVVLNLFKAASLELNICSGLPASLYAQMI